MTLVKFNPVRDLIDFEREFSKMFNSLENRCGISKSKDENDEYENAVWMPLTDIYENKDNFSLKIDLPGIKKEDVKISFTNGKLNISGERVQEEETKDAKCHRIEKSYGKYFRSFNLPELIQADKINDELNKGNFLVTLFFCINFRIRFSLIRVLKWNTKIIIKYLAWINLQPRMK